MTGPILGWDIGGANIKAALIDGDAATPVVVEQPFALWREPHKLADILADIASQFRAPQAMAATMTAELADCFATKREGVGFVLDALGTAFPRIDPWIYGTDGRFRSVAEARREPHIVAAANWMATATLVARARADAILIDVGSTTTDIVPISGGQVVASGRTDLDRLIHGELVYTGALRTPVCAIVRSLPIGDRQCRVAAELFAIAADAHLWLGEIAERDYSCETPDGRARSRTEAGDRLARMVCADRETIADADITAIAACVIEEQTRQIADGVRQVLDGFASNPPLVAVVAGHGVFLARRAACRAGLGVHDLAADLGSVAAARSAPATAVAYLLAETLKPESGPGL